MIKEKAERERQGWITYYQNQLSEIEESKTSLLNLSEILDTIGISPDKVRFTYSNSIEVNQNSIEESRVLLSKIFELSSIKEFVKLSRQKEEALQWCYHITFDKASLSIFPAEPNKDCIAVKKTNTYTSWVCEKKE